MLFRTKTACTVFTSPVHLCLHVYFWILCLIIIAFKVTLWNFRLTIVAMETQELCSMDITEVCHCQLYDMIFAALLAPEMSYSYLYRFSHVANVLVTDSWSRDGKLCAMLVNMQQRSMSTDCISICCH